jgi:ATP-dependent exoDNAse (exonuclease V) beta subunit
MLANKHTHLRDVRIKFDEPTHKYTIDGNTDYISVTTWVHTHFAKFDADAIISKMMQSSHWGKNKYFGKTREEIKEIWNANGKNAASAGTNLHHDIERYYNGLPVSNDTKEYKQFIEFSKTYLFEPYRTEWIIFDEELKLAGAIDMVYILPDGTLMIYDWKRSKGIIQQTQYAKYASTECIQHIPDTNYWHYVLQLNTYKSILERKYDKKVTRLCLVCLYPDQDNFILYDVPFIEEEMECLFQMRKTELNDINMSSVIIS